MSAAGDCAARFAPALLAWWDDNGRKDLPWQRDVTPYRVWVSEIMLQQTQVATVVRYFDRFMEAFPRLADLASADIDHVLHLWSGLGYYARARNMHRAAGMVQDTMGGELPTDIDQLIALPGIGRSTAGAILSLAMNQRHPILDGNVKRVLARVFALQGWPGSSKEARQFWDHAERCTPPDRVADYTQAIMDLGASVCARSKPGCSACPMIGLCEAQRRGIVGLLPTRRPARERPKRTTVLAVLVRPDGAVLLEKRAGNGIWGGLWGLPEADRVTDVADWCIRHIGVTPQSIERQPVVLHRFTHFDLDITPVTVALGSVPGRVMDDDRWLWYNMRKPARVGIATPVSRLIEEFGESVWDAR